MLLDELVRVRGRERELAKELEGRDAKIRGYRRALDVAGEKIADIVLAEADGRTTCVEREGCENEWHYWRCPEHPDHREEHDETKTPAG